VPARYSAEHLRESNMRFHEQLEGNVTFLFWHFRRDPSWFSAVY